MASPSGKGRHDTTLARAFEDDTDQRQREPMFGALVLAGKARHFDPATLLCSVQIESGVPGNTIV